MNWAIYWIQKSIKFNSKLRAEDLMRGRVIRTLKERCTHRHRFQSTQHATRVIGEWISFYNHRRPHQALAMRTPAKAFRLAA